jgi:hypothetical protein
MRNITRLRAYGSTALGTTALLASHSDAATVVDVNGTTYSTGLSGIGDIARAGSGGLYQSASVTTSAFVLKQSGYNFFQRGNNITAVAFSANPISSFQYSYQGNQAQKGAVLNSSDNWMLARSTDSTQEVWLQFSFGDNGDGTDFSILKAVFPDTVGELPSAASASAVPEPSALALLSLGASGLLIRRRNKAA